jgi:saccharopine dehydrogenase-like NADP-dependent oxidoreductase
VMLAATNDGRYLKDGKVVEIPGAKLFEHYWMLDVPGSGTFEAYVNRDALPYIEIYGLEGIRSMYRGTLRNTSTCESWNSFKKLGLLDQELKFEAGAKTVREVMAGLVKSDGKDLIKDMAAFLQAPEYSVVLKKLEWLGLFEEVEAPIETNSVFDLFAHFLLEKLVYTEGERDLLIQHHEFIAEYPDKKEKITSTMIDMGIPGGDSSMARTVSLPAAIATRLILEGKINLTGVHIPVLPEIYEPVLAELETMDIKLTERKVSL